ncbi:50S ribosomal protein L6 [Akkermansiaceae bacterium]|jgi:large subunit ribosomal protein L6|nr:50S ribosomal protein L6 [Akkermansiaceae bacterium]MDB4537024.1 50S ribosomal protein L6 [Akkermansiaceae bacterium]
MSRVGLKPIPVVDKVTLTVNGQNVSVEGPKGKLSLDLPEGITIKQNDTEITVERDNELRHVRALHGTFRSLVNNLIIGVTEGFVKELEIQGVGLRAAIKGKDLDLSLGKSHPILHPIPDGLNVEVTDNTKIKVEGIDKQLVGQFSAEVRAYYPPEPYKGKGVRYVGEYVRRKAGKSVK